MATDNLYPVERDDLYPGTTFYYRKPESAVAHLHIILTDPEEIRGKVLVVMVNLTTQRRGADNTVVLDVGDHPSIKHPSVVAYVYAELFPIDKLLRYLNEERSLIDYDLEPDVLRKVQQGLLESDFTPLEVLAYCREKF